MALKFIEGFDAYGQTDGITPSGLAYKWNPAFTPDSGWTVQPGRVQGKSLRMTGARYISSQSLGHLSTITVGFAFKRSTIGDNGRIVSLFEGTNEGINVRAVAGTGEFAVYFGNSLLDTTDGDGVMANEWVYLELNVTVHNSTGSYELRLHGQTVLSDTNVDTQPASNAWADIVRLQSVGTASETFYFDDFYVRDDSTFHGNVKVTTKFPTADSAVECTPSTGGDNYAMTDDNPSDDDSTYVSGGDGDSDVYEFGGFDPGSMTEVYGVMVNTICRETDVSPFNIKQLANSGESAADAIGSTSYVHRGAVFPTNPDTTDPWTPAEIAASTFGFGIET
ncbi:MAG: hypothetical protein DWQ37_05365 [Planctomycetota bacterium]|nr:MAG: hypothetical protein DWQ37_05365 [Planctomycetota bacterium]